MSRSWMKYAAQQLGELFDKKQVYDPSVNLKDLSGGDCNAGAARQESKGITVAPTQDICKNRHKGNPESQKAFRSVKDRLSEQQQRVLKAIRDSDNGLTVDEIATKLGVTPNMVSGRASELKRDGKIKKNGVRLTRSGCNAAVLVIT